MEEKKPDCFLLFGEGKAEKNSAAKARESNPTENVEWDLNCPRYPSSNWADISNSCSSGRCESLQELHEPLGLGQGLLNCYGAAGMARSSMGNKWNW